MNAVSNSDIAISVFSLEKQTYICFLFILFTIISINSTAMPIMSIKCNHKQFRKSCYILFFIIMSKYLTEFYA